MKIYSQEQVANIQQENFAFLEVEENDHILTVRFARENRKNALHPHMMNEIGFAFQYAHYEKSIWAVVVEAKGNVFCAGADLKAMAGIIEPHDSSIPKPEKEILFNELFSTLHKPLISKVKGDVYAGGFMFLAGSTFVVAADSIKLGLSEVKRGIYPFQVMAALLNVMPARRVLEWCVRGYNLPVQKAYEYGLVSEVYPMDKVDEGVNNILSDIKENSPTAIRLGLEGYSTIRPSKSEHEYLANMLKKAIMSKDGMEGLAAFREKRKPNWIGE